MFDIKNLIKTKFNLMITTKKMKTNVGKSNSAVNMCFVCFFQRYLLQSDDNDEDGVDK